VTRSWIMSCWRMRSRGFEGGGGAQHAGLVGDERGGQGEGEWEVLVSYAGRYLEACERISGVAFPR